jgi:hypothetical protein
MTFSRRDAMMRHIQCVHNQFNEIVVVVVVVVVVAVVVVILYLNTP